MSPIKRLWDNWNFSSASRSSAMPANPHSGGDVIDLTNSDNENDVLVIWDRAAGQTWTDLAFSPSPARAAATPSKATSSKATPSKSTVANTSTPGNRQDLVSPRSARLNASPYFASPFRSSPPTSRTLGNRTDQMAQTPTPRKSAAKGESLNVDKIASQLKSFSAEIEKANVRLVQFTLREIIKGAPERRHLSSVDDFADMPSIAQESGSASEGALQIKFKLHIGTDKPSRKKNLWFPVTNIKPNKQRVPKYRFHHVEITKNILTPNTMMKFIPFLRDMTIAEEAKYYQWINELRNMDQSTGMSTIALDPALKAEKIMRDEYAATLYAYLDRWIQKLGLEHLSKSSLIRYMAAETADGDKAITPQQKSTLLDSDIGSGSSPHSYGAAKAFTEAFDRVFGKEATLRNVLMLDETVETLVDNKRVKEPVSSQKARDEELLRDVEQTLATYSILGCLICFGHDCEHGEYDVENNKRSFSIDSLGRLGPLLKRKWIEQTKNNPKPSPGRATITPCKNECFQAPHQAAPVPDWKTEEVDVLRSMFATFGKSSIRPECAVASILGRKCWDVRDKLVALNLTLPYTPVPPEAPRAKNVPWYDRNKKMLFGDWHECTISHEHYKREILDPCHHDGPCTAANKCPCVLGKLLCERFCQCTADCCAYKFTGCACHSTGKTCLERQKEGKPCICVQLNRECDPGLCKGCGAAERADPENAHDDALHATGCQNVALQRGVSKAVLMGKSQLEGCGYGLFTAEDIAQDEFVIEYAGELISHDEGVRREARRGNVFDETSNSSYLFTLLDTEGIWVDAAIYGNLSRYINHAGEGDKRGANITPKILYVNGEFRIRFSAMRDIKTGEELFFNYGENFPNLTKKLLEDKDAEAAEKRKGTTSGGAAAAAAPKRKPGRPPGKSKNKQKEAAAAELRGSPANKPGRPRGRAKATKQAPPPRPPPPTTIPESDAMDWEASPAGGHSDDDRPDAAAGPSHHHHASPSEQKRRRRAGGRRPLIPDDDDDDDDDEYDEYRPTDGATATDSQDDEEDEEDEFGGKLSAYTLARDRRRRKARPSQSLRHFVSGEYDDEVRAAAGGALVGSGSDPKSVAAKAPRPPPTSTQPHQHQHAHQQSKRVSRRGGARPGAGRKPKNPRPVAAPAAAAATTTTQAAAAGGAAGAQPAEGVAVAQAAAAAATQTATAPGSVDQGEESSELSDVGEEETEEEFRGEEADSDDSPLVEQGRGYLTRKRKRGDASEDEDDNGRARGDRYGDASVLGGGGADEEEEEDVYDRSRRKRQKPARYRADDE